MKLPEVQLQVDHLLAALRAPRLVTAAVRPVLMPLEAPDPGVNQTTLITLMLATTVQRVDLLDM